MKVVENPFENLIEGLRNTSDTVTEALYAAASGVESEFGKLSDILTSNTVEVSVPVYIEQKGPDLKNNHRIFLDLSVIKQEYQESKLPLPIFKLYGGIRYAEEEMESISASIADQYIEEMNTFIGREDVKGRAMSDFAETLAKLGAFSIQTIALKKVLSLLFFGKLAPVILILASIKGLDELMPLPRHAIAAGKKVLKEEFSIGDQEEGEIEKSFRKNIATLPLHIDPDLYSIALALKLETKTCPAEFTRDEMSASILERLNKSQGV